MSTAAPRPAPPDRACLSYWFPLLEAAGVPVPRTVVVRTAPDLDGPELLALLEDDGPRGPKGAELIALGFDKFVLRLMDAYRAVVANGTEPPPKLWPMAPVFLRTGHTAGKHNWRNTCCVPDASALVSHVAALVAASAEAHPVFPLPTDVWAVRELIPVTPIVELPRYAGLPLAAELRAFVKGGEVRCVHAYWPPDAVRQGFYGDIDEQQGRLIMALASTVVMDDIPAVWNTLSKVAAAFAGESAGAWSVDLLLGQNGVWYATDMAPAERSYHDPLCAFAHADAPLAGVAS